MQVLQFGHVLTVVASELVARPPRQYRGIFSLSRVSTTYDFPILGRLTSPFKGLFYIDMSGLKGD
jgi:hypothetical protein